MSGDFFVSFNKADRAWADWIAWTLEEAGYEVVYQPWDFLPGNNFVLKMQEAAGSTRKTVIVLTESYLQAEYTQPEWAAAFAEDPRGDQRKLIPFRVAPCSPSGMLKSLIYSDLVGLSDEEAKAEVLRAVDASPRGKPAHAPSFPGSPRNPAPPFPGGEPPPPRLDLGRLPIAGPLLIGREAELARLGAAWENPGLHVLTFVAFGGMGKSALVSHWLDRMSADGWRGARRVLDWSFYSQGTEDRGTSADRFLDHALTWFGDPDPKAGAPRDRGLRLAELEAGGGVAGTAARVRAHSRIRNRFAASLRLGVQCRPLSLTTASIRSSLLCMRTTLDIPEPLLEEARDLLGFKSKTDTVVLALQELVRRRRIEELKSLLGSVRLEIDIPKSRRRP